MFQCMVGVSLVRQDRSILWKMLGLGAGESVVLQGWFSELCGCVFEGWVSVLCGCSGHILFESLLRILCGCGGISFKNSVDSSCVWVFNRLKFRFIVQNFFIFVFVSIFVFVLFC